MRKIAIVGATPEAFIQLSLLINNRRYDGKEKYGDDEFTLIHDPDKVYPYMLSGIGVCLLYTSPSPRDGLLSRMPSSA